MVRINAVLREDIVEGIDQIAKERGESRSSLLREAAQKLIREHRQIKAKYPAFLARSGIWKSLTLIQ